jgi:hypothetical protein
MNRRIEPLSPEERDLAERLARLGGPREPAPALDAAILAAARAAVATDAGPRAAAEAAAPAAAAPTDPKVAPLRPRPTKPRWPLGFGLAASLVLAAGIGWKLQGDGEGSSAESAQAAAMAEHDEAIEAVMIDPPAAPPPPPPMEAAADAAARASAPESGAPRIAEPVREPPSGFVADAAPMAAPAPVTSEAFATSAPAPAAEARVAEDKGELDSVTVTGSRVAPQRSVGAAEYTRTPLNQRREQATAERESGSAAKAAPPPPPPPAAPPAPPPPPAPVSVDRARSGNAAERDAAAAVFDERPPVSADSPEFRQAWLQRIRERLARGEEQAARESLQEFRRRYPDVELPEDLRKLAATLPPPAP